MTASIGTVGRPARSISGLWAVLGGVAVLVVHAPAFFHRLLDGDEAIYASIAALMNVGSPQ
jgi:hypothetical protein